MTSTTSQSESRKPAVPLGTAGGMLTLQGMCHRAAGEVKSREEFLQKLAGILQRVVNPDVIVRLTPQNNGEFQLDGLLHPAQGLAEDFRQALMRHGVQSISQKSTHVSRLGRPPSILLIAVPVLRTEGCFESVAAIFTAPPATADVLISVLELVVSQLALFDARSSLRRLDDANETAAAILDLISRLDSSADYATAANRLVQELAQFLDGPQVCLLTLQRSRLNLSAHTGFDYPTDEQQDLIRAAGDEALIRGEAGIWPVSQATERHGLLTHRQLATRLGKEAVISLPLLDEASRPHGVLILTGDTDLIDPPDALAFLQALTVPLASCLTVLQRAERSAWSKWIGSVWEKIRSRRGGLIAAGVGLACAAMFVPLPYHVNCDCELQPVTRRYIASPFEGRLETSSVEPGDVVKAGQLLASLDPREIQWEQEGVQADLHRALKERDGHLAAGEYGQAEIARLESERLRLKLELLTHRGSRLEITSPIDGLVVSGDLRKTEGAPVTLGQTLFEVAPLNEMLFELWIPEEEIAYVRQGMSVEVTLDAFPERRWTATVSRIHPRAQLHDEQQVFLAEFKLTNDHELLRPGMAGRAKITSASHPLGWNLFHHAGERLLMWIGW